MSVSVDAVNTAVIVFNSVTSFSGTPITVTAAATSVLAGIDFTDATATTKPTSVVITWGAQTLSIVLGADTGFLNGASHSNRAVLYGKELPTIGAQTFAGAWTNAYSGYANIVSWKGGDTTTPFKNGTATGLVSDTAPTVSVTSPAGDFAAGVCAVDSDSINAVGQTTWWNNATGSFGNSFANYTAGAGATTLSGTLGGGAGWTYAACDVQVSQATPFVPSTIAGYVENEW